jgi:hypothetical protein
MQPSGGVSVVVVAAVRRERNLKKRGIRTRVMT